jgi:hypothetical protein
VLASTPDIFERLRHSLIELARRDHNKPAVCRMIQRVASRSTREQKKVRYIGPDSASVKSAVNFGLSLLCGWQQYIGIPVAQPRGASDVRRYSDGCHRDLSHGRG